MRQQVSLALVKHRSTEYIMESAAGLTNLVLETSRYLAGDCLSAADITFAALVSVC
jgi:glutathione S-transferase